MNRLLMSTAPALITILVGMILHNSAVMVAGALAVLIITAATPLAIAALRNHRSMSASLGATAGAMAIRLIGLVLAALLVSGTSQVAVTVSIIAACLFINLIIEGVITARVRVTHAGEGVAHV